VDVVAQPDARPVSRHRLETRQRERLDAMTRGPEAGRDAVPRRRVEPEPGNEDDVHVTYGRGDDRDSPPEAYPRPMDCDYFDRAVCRSCRWLAAPYAVQLERKWAAARAAVPGATWLEPVASRESGFRNKAKMVVSGTIEAPNVGILDAHGVGVDLRECGLHTPGIRAALPHLADFVTSARLDPYDVPARRREL